MTFKELTKQAQKCWKDGTLTYNQYWMVRQLENGFHIGLLKTGYCYTPEEVEHNMHKINQALGIDYQYELREMELNNDYTDNEKARINDNVRRNQVY